jgi:hypothetical protein
MLALSKCDRVLAGQSRVRAGTYWPDCADAQYGLGSISMTEPPPSNPADHAEDFSRRYAEDLDIVAGQAMVDLRIPDHQMGARDPDRNREIHSFFPRERTGGSIAPARQITLDSGLMNPDLLAANYDEATQEMWRKTRLIDRAHAIIAHELAEHEYGGDHELALIAGPETKLSISDRARVLLRQMECGRRGR